MKNQYTILSIMISLLLCLIVSCKDQNKSTNNKNDNAIVEKISFEDEIKMKDWKDLNKKGLVFYKEKKYNTALKYFDAASNIIDYKKNNTFINIAASYNYACVLSILYGEKKYNDLSAIIEILKLTFDYDYKNKWLRKAANDKDFSSIKNNVKFKQLLIFSNLRYSLITNKNDYFISNLSKLKDKNFKDSFGHGLLFYAVKEDNPDAIKLLFKSGSDINKGFFNDNSILIYMAFASTSSIYKVNYYKMIEFFIESGADINTRLDDYYPFQEFEEYYMGFYNQPLEEGEEPAIYNNTMLEIAFISKNLKLIKLLFENDANINLQIDIEESNFKHVFDSYFKSEKKNIIDLFRKHKDKKNAIKFIDYINSVKKI